MRVRSESVRQGGAAAVVQASSGGRGHCRGTGAAQERTDVELFQREIQEAPEVGC